MTLIRRLILSLALMAGVTPAMAQLPPPVPALPDTERRTSYSITASTCSCNINFQIYGDSTDYQNWVEVWLNGVRVNFNDASHGWAITVPTGTLSTRVRPITDATLTFNAAQTGTVQIVGARRPRRAFQLNENTGVSGRNFNLILTDIISQNREIWDKTNDVTGRALMSQPGNTIGLLPLPSVCASAVLGFDASGLNPVCMTGGGAGNVILPTVPGSLAMFTSTTGILASAPPTVVTPEQFGYGCSLPGCIPYGTGDVTPVITAAVASVPSPGCVKVNFGDHQYNYATPYVASRDCVWLAGKGNSTGWYFTPGSCNTSMITYHGPDPGHPISFGRITDAMILSPDHSCVKTGINVIDVGDMEISGLYFAIWSDATFNSSCIKTNGRQTSSFHDIRGFCDLPIDIQPNPNSGLAADHFHFWNLYLSPADTQPAIRAGDLLFTNTTFDGFQAWVGGTHGFYYNAPTAGRGTNLSFYNVRTENNAANPGAQDHTAYSFYINKPGGIGNVLIKGAKLDEGRQGIYGRGILSLSVEQPYYPPVSPAAMKFLDVDTTVLNVNVRDARFESGVTQSLGGLAVFETDNVPSTAPIPTTAKYGASGTGTLTKSSIVNSGNILSSTFNNIVLNAPASTAFLSVGSGKSVGFEAGLDFKGVDGTQLTFQGTDTYVGRATTDTLTNKSISGSTNTLSSIANASLVNSATTVNGQTCTLGSTCTVTVVTTVGSTTISGGTTGRVLFDNAGFLGEYPITGTGNVVLSASPTFTGNITASTLDNIIFTTPASTATLTLGSAKTVTLSNTLTFAGTDGSTLNVGAGGTLGSNAFTSTAYAPLASPTFTGTVTIPSGAALATPATIVLTNATGTAASLTAGTATNTAITDDTATNAAMNLTWVTSNTGNLPQKTTSTKLTFNPSTGALSSTSFTGAGTGLTGTASSLTAGDVANAPVIAKVLTGFSSGAGTISAADSILTAIQKNAGNDALKAPLASPTLTGTPAAPTAAVDTNTTQVATTAMVLGQAASATPLIDGTAAVGTSTRYARGDHVHPTDTSRAPLVSPSFTTPLLGVATATSINGAAVDNAAWSSYSGSVGAFSCTSGTITASVGSARFKNIGKTYWMHLDITETSNAACGGAIILASAFPATPNSSVTCTGINKNTFVGLIGTAPSPGVNSMNVTTAAATIPITGNGQFLSIDCTFEST